MACTLGPTDFDVQLGGGASTTYGLVKIYQNSTWFGVCDKYFNFGAAQVICRQTGFLYADHYGISYATEPFAYCMDDVTVYIYSHINILKRSLPNLE